MTIQQQIDAAANAGGGIVSLPLGDFSKEGPLYLRSDVTLRGAGCRITTIPPIARAGSRLYHCCLENVAVDCKGGYMAIDWSQITSGSIKHVLAMNAQYGMYLTANCERNMIVELYMSGITTEGIELYNSANQNTFVGGNFNAPLPINIIESNGNTFIGCSLEGDKVKRPFLKRSGYTKGTTMNGVRCEIDTVYGPIWLWGQDQTWTEAN